MSAMLLIWTLIIGLVVGVIAKLLMPGRDPGGVIVTMLLGIGGAFLATVIGHSLGWYRHDQGAGLIASVIGAVLILAAYRALNRRRRVL
jgi:uncharacterized membrane protein YeaQ/YmgE (transglycosylase-associated protein family)